VQTLKDRNNFNGLDESLKYESWKIRKKKLTEINSLLLVLLLPQLETINEDFAAPNPEGKVVSLKESLGKVTIVDFWASWCAPCRRENPNVVAIYKDLHSKDSTLLVFH
jgi:thiol-disulfide isomerase/thioredoxin